MLASIGEFPHKTQIFRYKNNPDDVYVAQGVDYFKMDMNQLSQLFLQAFFAVLSDESLVGKLLDADYYLQYMSKSKLPHLKLKDWKKSGRVTTMTIDDILTAFEEQIQETEEKRKKLGK